jgi:hypothetical protein
MCTTPKTRHVLRENNSLKPTLQKQTLQTVRQFKHIFANGVIATITV